MSKIQAPIIGRSRGSAGGMTFTKMHGENVMRAKPFEVANPRTPAQVTQRNYFAELSALSASFSKEQLRTLFPTMPKGMPRRSALTKQLAEDYSVAGSVKSIDFAHIDTLGNAPSMDFGTTSCSQVGTTISVAIDNSVKGNTELADNYFCVALVNQTLGAIVMPTNTALVSTGTLSITAPAGWLATHAIHAIPLILDDKTGALASAGFGTLSVAKRPVRGTNA